MQLFIRPIIKIDYIYYDLITGIKFAERLWLNIIPISNSQILLLNSIQLLMKQVMQRNFLRSGKILGTFKLDVATVMSQQGIIDIDLAKGEKLNKLA